MNIPLTFSLTNPDDADGGEWIDIEQVEYPDPRATLGQLAGFMDTLFDIDPCDPDKVSDVLNNEDNKTSVWGAPPEETFDFIVEKELTPEICDFGNNEYEATLNIYRSDLKEDTRLVLSVGKQGLMFIVNEEVEEHIKIEFATGHVLKYPVTATNSNGFKHKWLSAVILRSGEDGTDVPVKLGRDGRTLSWGDKAISGTLKVNYPTQYEQVRVLIPFNELGKPQKAKATIFYMGLVDEETIEPPEADEGDEETRERWCPDRDLDSGKYDHIITKVPFPKHTVKCFIEVTVDVLCQCSGELSHSYTRKDYTACPERTRCYDRQTSCEKNIGRRTEIKYTNCGEVTGDMNDPEFYEENCCYTPEEAEVTLPSCKRVYSSRGKVDIKQEVIDSYHLQYRGYTVNFISVMPEDGYCGKHIVEQKLVARACCDEVLTMTKDKEYTSTAVSAGSYGTVAVLDGSGKYTYTCLTKGVTINGKTKYVSGSQMVQFYVSPSVCGVISIICSDGCTSVEFIIRSSNGQWVVRTHEWPGRCRWIETTQVSLEDITYSSPLQTHGTADYTDEAWRQVEVFSSTDATTLKSIIVNDYCDTYFEDNANICLPSGTTNAEFAEAICDSGDYGNDDICLGYPLEARQLGLGYGKPPYGHCRGLYPAGANGFARSIHCLCDGDLSVGGSTRSLSVFYFKSLIYERDVYEWVC